MKKLIIILIASFCFVLSYGQSGTVSQQEYTPEVIQGQVNDTIEFNKINGEFDVSLQLVPAATGAGTSLAFTHIIYQSNHGSDAAWTAITSSVTVNSATDADALVAITDFKGLRLRAILIGTSTDTVTVTPYSVYKKHRKE